MAYNPKTLTVPQGGTALTTLTTPYGVVCAGTTATGSLQNAGAGTSGQLLGSGGASALPSYRTFPSVSVYAYLSSNKNAVTGDGTEYKIIFDTAVVNTGGQYDASTGLFTPTTSGLYRMTYGLLTTGTNAFNTIFNSFIKATGGNYGYFECNGANCAAVAADSGWFAYSMIGYASMTAGQTASVALKVFFNATKNVNVISGVNCSFSIESVGF